MYMRAKIDKIDLHKDSVTPLYVQIYTALRRMILAGEIAPGARLPATRTLAQRWQVARITVTEAYAQLQAEGFVESRPGAGTFVPQTISPPLPAQPHQPQLTPWGRRLMKPTAQPKRPLPAKPDIDFGFGRSFSHAFPYDVWRRLLARYLSTDDAMLSQYGSAAGFLPLQEALAAYLSRQRGVNCEPEQIVIVSGAQQAVDLLSRLLLNPGDGVLMETPGYRDAYEIFQANGATIQTIAVDEHGLPVAAIPADCRARLLFVTPSNQFPHGGAMPLARRLRLLAWARNHEAVIVEDDYDGELRYDGRPLSSLQGLDREGRVVYLGTFSKVLFPALRLGYVALPQALVQPFVQAKGLVDRGAPTLTQAAVADFIVEGHFERHLRHLRQAYGERRQALVEALQTHLDDRVQYVAAPAGLHVMLYLPPELAETAVIQQAAALGVGIYPGAPYHLPQPVRPSILLGFSGLTTEQIAEGVRRLATVIG